MKVLLIITDYGSFNNFLSEVAVQLLNAGHEVHVICSLIKVIDCKDKHPYKEMGIQFHYYDFPRSFNLLNQLKASRKINKKIVQLDPDLINIHFTTGIFTTLLSSKPRCLTIGTLHGVGYPMIRPGLKRNIFKAVERFCFKRLDQVYLINQFDYNLVKDEYPEKAFFYNSFGVGCDIRKFDPFAITNEFKARFRKDLQIKENDFVIAFTGRFVAFKGYHLVVKAVNSLVNRYGIKNIKLLLIGGEDQAHASGLTKQEKAACDRNNSIIKVRFTTEVNLYLSITDLFVFPSEKEGMPVCVMEALSMGVPVVTANSRGCNDLVKHNFNGLLLSDNPTVAETREAILKLYRDAAMLKRFSDNALSRRNEFSRQRYVEDQIEVYTHLSKNKDYKYA